MLILLIIKISRFARNDKKTNCDTVSSGGHYSLRTINICYCDTVSGTRHPQPCRSRASLYPLQAGERKLMRLAKKKRSEVRSVSGISEFQVSEVKRTEICWTNYPLCEAHKDIPEAKRSGISDGFLNNPVTLPSRINSLKGSYESSILLR
jgi:hypothetical protein